MPVLPGKNFSQPGFPGFPRGVEFQGRKMVKMFLFTWIFQKYSFRHIRAKAQKPEKETQNLHDLYRLHDLYHGECLVLLDTGTKAEPKQVPGTT